jgi:predicted O-linked N-acetylglucosamine transferase (SPINDLY family)
VNTQGRNDICSCGSGKKYKQCCMLKTVKNQIIRGAQMATSSNAVVLELQAAIKHFQAGQFSEAESICQKLLQITPNHPEALYLLGLIAYDAKAYETAFNHVTQAKRINPSNPFYPNLLGSILCEQDKLDEAVTAHRLAISLKPDFAEALHNLGNAYQKQDKLNEAIASYQKAISIKPNYANAYSHLGRTFYKQGNYNSALDSYRKAIFFNPNLADAYCGLGDTLFNLNRLDEALANYNKAIALKPDLTAAGMALGGILCRLNRFDEALIIYNRTPDCAYLPGEILHTRMQLCKWDDFHHLKENLIKLVQSDSCAASPFIVVTLTDSLTLQRKAAEIHVKCECPANISRDPIPVRAKKEKIKIGYFSSDFGNHPITHLMVGLFESHDKNNFEITAFSFGPERNDNWKERVVLAFDNFVDVQLKSDKEIAMLARSMGIDIAVDLNGFTANSRPFIFAERAAPIQINYIGYLGTLGSEYIDYLIADSTIVPEDKKEFYTEKIVYLPNYQCNDNKLEISTKIFKRSAVGLPDNGVVFCSFNNNYKITPDVFHLWMKILKRVEGSVLWLFVRNKTAENNLKIEAKKQGIDITRIVFAGVLPRDEHLSRLNLADIFLDTYPCNAGATASDALRMGVPILTRTGETFASRVAASLLNAVGLPELITTTEEEYEELAVELATDKKKLTSLKLKLVKNLVTSALFDQKSTTKHIEAAYTEMYERYHAGLPPNHIYIK